MLAEAGAPVAFNFTDFQQGFTEVWDFIVPNVILILLCVGTAKFVGKLQLPWLSTRVDRIQEWLKKFSQFLDETKLFGSKLLPALACIVFCVTALDVVDMVTDWIARVCPPHIYVDTLKLYERTALPDDLLHIALKQRSLTRRYQLYLYLDEWQDRIKEDKTLPDASYVSYSFLRVAQWLGYTGSVKILFIVALLSSIGGLVTKTLKLHELWRLIVILSVLVVAYAYCVANYLYAHVTLAESCLIALAARYDLEPDTDWSALLQQRVTKLDGNDDVLTEKFSESNRLCGGLSGHGAPTFPI